MACDHVQGLAESTTSTNLRCDRCGKYLMLEDLLTDLLERVAALEKDRADLQREVQHLKTHVGDRDAM